MTTVSTLERGAHLVGAYVERAARASGVTQAEAHVLVQLAQKGPLSIASLHREFGTKRTTLTNILDRLERRGFVRRELNPSDRRSFTIHLTRSGQAPARQAARVVADLEAAVRASVSERDLRGLEAVVAALATVVHEDAAAVAADRLHRRARSGR